MFTKVSISEVEFNKSGLQKHETEYHHPHVSSPGDERGN